MKRFDEYGLDGEKVEIFFVRNTRLERQIRRANNAVPSDEAFNLAVADDSHLIREADSVMDVARPLSSEFENEPETRPYTFKPATRKKMAARRKASASLQAAA